MIKPILKWAGGKSRLLPELLPLLPPGDRLIEPFAGSGVVFLNTNYKSYLLNDLNRDLISLYRVLSNNDLQRLSNELFLHHQRRELRNDSKAFYCECRSAFNTDFSLSEVERAAIFLYLNRHCFNGLCRYNKSGHFNVPHGKYKSIKFPQNEIVSFAEKLSVTGAELYNYDFNSVINMAGVGDVIYCDPPYIDTFTNYTDVGFFNRDQGRLVTACRTAVERGASVVISNSDNPITRDLYRGFFIHEITARRSISGNADLAPAKEIVAVLTPEDL